MKEAFEKILERLEELQNNLLSQTEGDVSVQVGIINGVMYSKKIVQEVAEEYNGGWIPCSERLPEESGTYIVNAIENSIIPVTFAKWMPRMKKWNLTGCRSYWKVNAWQPLPEPFKERD